LPRPGRANGWRSFFYSPNNNWLAEDRRRLLAFVRDPLNSDHAGRRLTSVRFAKALHFNHLNAVYNAFDFSGPLEFVKKAAGLSDRVG
jgi:4-hydroxyphenylacetate 3-monooxygenase